MVIKIVSLLILLHQGHWESIKFPVVIFGNYENSPLFLLDSDSSVLRRTDPDFNKNLMKFSSSL